MPAQRGAEVIRRHLETLELSLDIVTDGVSLMRKLRTILTLAHELYHNHGIHWAVTDILDKSHHDRTVVEKETQSLKMGCWMMMQRLRDRSL